MPTKWKLMYLTSRRSCEVSFGDSEVILYTVCPNTGFLHSNPCSKERTVSILNPTADPETSSRNDSDTHTRPDSSPNTTDDTSPRPTTGRQVKSP